MDVSDLVSTEFEAVDPDTTASELEGIFGDPAVEAVVVLEDGEYAGVITRRQLASAHRNPDAKARGLIWRVAEVDRTADVRSAAGLLVGSRADLLPVFDGGELVGVVTTGAVLEAVRPFLEVLTVEDVYSRELVTAEPGTTLGEALHALREHRITHLPVVEDGEAAGIVSLYDVVDFTTREVGRAQGGSSGVEGASHGGFGERAGDLERMLDLPVSDVMSAPVWTTTPGERLDSAVATMLEEGVSSLVVTRDGAPTGILTTTDVLGALTLTDGTRMPVQITNVDLMDDITREEVADLIERTARKFGDMRVLEANVYLHEHDETLRGVPLLVARIRLFTDKGHFVGTGEGYGAAHAIHLARNVLERQLLEGKEYGRTKKHPSEEELSKMLGWWLTGSPRRR